MSRVKFIEDTQAESDYSETAAKIVNNAINDAIHQLEKQLADDLGISLDNPTVFDYMDRAQTASVENGSKTPLLTDPSEQKSELPNIEWMSIDKFGRELAQDKIDEFIKKVSCNRYTVVANTGTGKEAMQETETVETVYPHCPLSSNCSSDMET